MPTNTTQTPSLGQLQRAVEIAQKIQGLQTELQSLLGSQPMNRATAGAGATQERTNGTATPVASVAGGGKKRRRMSAEARAKIAAAASARWARIKGTATGGGASKSAAKAAPAATGGKKARTGKKRTLSAETRAKIAEASRRRWAAKRQATGG